MLHVVKQLKVLSTNSRRYKMEHAIKLARNGVQWYVVEVTEFANTISKVYYSREDAQKYIDDYGTLRNSKRFKKT